MESSAQAQRTRSGLAAMAICLAVLSGLAVGELCILAAQPPTILYEELLAQYDAADPVAGLTVALPECIKVSREQQLLLVLLGICGGCSMTAPKLTTSAVDRFDSIVLVSIDEMIDASMLPVTTSHTSITHDRTIHAKLNAYFTPRFAVIDGNGALLGLQARDQDPIEFLQGF